MPSLEMKLETSKEIGRCVCHQLEFISLDQHYLSPHPLTGSYLCLESIEYGKISNGSIHVIGKEYKVCLNWGLINVKK